MAEARDPVGVANDVNWLVDYYLDHGRRDDALRAATFAADVYSSAGLKALARLMERLGRYDDAGAWYHRLVERYEDEDTIAQFYLRYRERVGGDRYQAEAQAALAKVFPQGLTKTTLADFREAPPDENGFGWRVMTRGMTEQLRRAGLQPGDLVVAADGYRVRDANQWVTIRSFRDDPTVSLIVWRGDRYITLDGPYVRQKFGPVDALPAGAHP
jgi:tetratricopeptide (TPR) repeat protein